MKIIKRGTIKKEVTRETCPKCNTIFEYEPKDVQYCSDQRDNYVEYWVKCPVCKYEITIKR